MDIRQKVKTGWSRLLGERGPQDILHPADILESLKGAADRDKKYFKERTFVPETYTVYLSSQDLSALRPLLDVLKAELEEEAAVYFKKKGLQINGPGVTVEFEERLVIRPGTVEVEGRFEKGKAPVNLPLLPRDSRGGGSDMAARLVISPATPHETAVVLKQGVHVVGRGREADVVVPNDPLISKTHCSVEVARAGVTVKDLQSANGTIVNGRIIEGPTRLDPGDRLLLGKTEIGVVW